MSDDEQRREAWVKAHATVRAFPHDPDPAGDLTLLARGIRHTGDARLTRQLAERLARQRTEEADDGTD
jgi:hypothetical protein